MNGSIAATMRNQLDTVVRASTEWLCAGSNAAQVETLGYNTDNVLECLGERSLVRCNAHSTTATQYQIHLCCSCGIGFLQWGRFWPALHTLVPATTLAA